MEEKRDEKKIKKSFILPKGILNVIGVIYLFFSFPLFFIPYILLWGEMDLTVGLWPFVLALVAGFVAHELLHAVGFLAFGRIPRRAIKFGVHWSWQVIMPYCTCSVPVPAYIYRIAVLLPGIVLGVLPALLGIILKEANMTFWGALMFAGAGGDFTILWLIRSVPASALVRDHPSEIGCEILDE